MEESSNSIDNTMYLTAGMPELIPQISVDVPSDQSDSSNDLTCKTDFEIQVERLDLEDSFPSSLHNPHSLMFDGTNSEISEYSPYKVSLSRLEEIKKSFEDVDLTSTANNLPKEPEELPENYVEESKHTEFKLIVSRASLVYDGWMGLKSYYVYAIITNIKEQRFKVNRRFRDVEWLNDIIRDRYKGFSIPPLPEKTIFHNSDAKFLEIRRKEIEQYLEMLARHPVLKESLPFKLFLQCSDVKWDKEQQNLTISKVCFQYNDIEDVLDQIVTKLEARLNLLFSRRVVPFSKDLACIERVLNILEAPTFSLSSSFKTWITAQHRTVNLLTSITFPDSVKFSIVMHEYRTLIKGNLSELHNLSSEFKVESLKVDALKSAILDYKSIMSRYSEIDLLITRKFSKQRYTDDPSKCEKYVKEIKTAQSEIEKLEKDLEKIENNVKNEYVWFTADRNQHIEDSINSIVLSQRSRFLMESEFWLNKKHETLKL